MTRDAAIEAAAAALARGELVAFPTETVYGLGADARSPAAVARIYAAKGRPPTHPLIVHVRDFDAARPLARLWLPLAERLARRFWPGPLTLVLPRAPGVPVEVTGGQDTVALRVPSHPIAQALLAAFDGPIAAPSANRYGHVSPTAAAHVRAEFGATVAYVLDGGDCEIGLESTIVGIDDSGVTLLRPGHVTRRALEAVVGPVFAPGGAAPRVPGSVRSHYAPATPTRLIDRADLEAALAAAGRTGRRIGLLCRGEAPALPAAQCRIAPGGAVEFGHDLYANLRWLDGAGVDEILIEAVPADEDWDAVRDRLQRAAARDSGEDAT
jgi:L-threonylcarbamoyladenylate synthase